MERLSLYEVLLATVLSNLQIWSSNLGTRRAGQGRPDNTSPRHHPRIHCDSDMQPFPEYHRYIATPSYLLKAALPLYPTLKSKFQTREQRAVLEQLMYVGGLEPQ